MKIRTNYVSNSSSSSYIVPSNLTDKGVACIKLSKEQIDNLSKTLEQEELKMLCSFQEYWLTRPIKEYEDDKIYEALNSTDKVHYSDMQMCGVPYDEDAFFCYDVLGDAVYIMLQDVKGEVLTRENLCKFLKEKFDKNQKFILNFSNNTFTMEINKED